MDGMVGMGYNEECTTSQEVDLKMIGTGQDGKLTKDVEESLKESTGIDPVADSAYERALSKTGYGKFHYCALVLFAGTYVGAAMEVTLVSLVIPAAKCDFSMSSKDIGYLTAIPMLGMALGSFFCGISADLFGRQAVLVASLVTGGLCGILSSLAQYFSIFMLFRFFNGFAMAGALSICLPYMGEYQPLKIREKVLCWMEITWATGIILLPIIGWVIIPLDIEVKSDYFLFRSWNLFVIISATPALLFGFWALCFPESPKYLFEKGEHEKCLEVMKHMYHVNTGQPKETFPVDSLEEKGISIIGFTPEYTTNDKPTTRRSLNELLKCVLSIAEALFQPPLRKKTLLCCSISFGITGCYYTMMLWFPELFTRFEYYAILNPGKKASVCEVSSVFIEKDGPCKVVIEDRVYLNTVILGMACIPTSIWLATCVNKLGIKFFIVFCVFAAGFISMGMYFVTSSIQNLVLSCLYEAMTSLSVMTLYCAIVEMFPANVRAMASGLTMGFGRMGALLGNLIFGHLIDFDCIVPFMLCSGLLFGSGIGCIFLPINRQTKKIEFV